MKLGAAGRRAGSRDLGSYEMLVQRVISAQHKLAKQSKNDAVRAIVAEQVDMTRQVTSAYTSAARKLIS